MLERTVNVTLAMGLHARPAARFVELARSFSSEVWIARDESGEADAKDPIAVLALDIGYGETVTVGADGSDEARAVDSLSAVLAGRV